MDLLAERPYEEVTIEDICDRAEVGRATFFRVYGTKVGLLEEFSRRLSADVRSALEAADGRSATERLVLIQQVIADTWQRSSTGMQALASEVARAGIPPSDRPLYPDLSRVTGAVVADGIASGEFAARGLRPNYIGWLIVSTLASCVAGSIRDDHPESIAESTRAGLDLLLSGLRD